MSRLVPAASAPRLERLLGKGAVELRVNGVLIPNTEHSRITVRRGRTLDAPTGKPAVCSVTVSQPSIPDWKPGQSFDVRLSNAALALLYPGDAAAQAEARYRFVGTLGDDIKVKITDEAPVLVDLIAQGTLARLGSLTIGSTPWPQEGSSARSDRIIAEVKALDPAVKMSRSVSTGMTVSARDVDSTSAQDLLAELANDDGGFVLNELRDGTLDWADPGGSWDMTLLPLDAVARPVELQRQVPVNDVTVVYGPKAGPPVGQEVAQNRLPNPSFEVDLATWAVSNGIRDTGTKASGTASARGNVATTQIGANISHITPKVQASAGARLAMRSVVRTSVAAPVSIRWRAYNAAGARVGTDTAFVGTPIAANVWTTVGSEYVVPDGATQVDAYVQRQSAQSATEYLWTDNHRMWAIVDDADPDFGDYFDGNTTADDAYTYAWSGTAHNSISSRRSTGRAPRLEFRAIDQANIDANGRRAVRIVTTLPGDALIATYSASLRATLALRSAEWSVPTCKLDVLALSEAGVGLYEYAAPAHLQALRTELGGILNLYNELPTEILRTNLAPNPAPKANVTGWSAWGSTIAWDAAELLDGGGSLKATDTGGGSSGAYVRVTPGEAARLGIRSRVKLAAAQNVTVGVRWNGPGLPDVLTSYTTTAVAAGAITTVSAVVDVPAGVTTADVVICTLVTPTGQASWHGRIVIEPLAVGESFDLAYFDGDSATSGAPGGIRHKWTGTAYASPSIEYVRRPLPHLPADGWSGTVSELTETITPHSWHIEIQGETTT